VTPLCSTPSGADKIASATILLLLPASSAPQDRAQECLHNLDLPIDLPFTLAAQSLRALYLEAANALHTALIWKNGSHSGSLLIPCQRVRVAAEQRR